jgi:hypothetical protein
MCFGLLFVGRSLFVFWLRVTVTFLGHWVYAGCGTFVLASMRVGCLLRPCLLACLPPTQMHRALLRALLF